MPLPSKAQLSGMAAFRLRKAPQDITEEEIKQERAHFRALSPGQAEAVNSIIHLIQLKVLKWGDKTSVRAVGQYQRIENQVLASLHLALKEKHMTVARRLALQLALDVRQPITGDPGRFEYIVADENHVLWEWPSVASKLEASDPTPPALTISRGIPVLLLDCISTRPLRVDDALDLIESALGRVPAAIDCLPPETARFIYWSQRDKEERVRVRLWINELEVKLPAWRDVHDLLHAMCRNRKFSMRLKDIEESETLHASNPSQACKRIQQALEAAFVGAGGWLQTRPVSWATGQAPVAMTKLEERRFLHQNKRKIKTLR